MILLPVEQFKVFDARLAEKAKGLFQQ